MNVMSMLRYLKILCLMKKPEMKTGSSPKNIIEGCVKAITIPIKLNIKVEIGLNILEVKDLLFLKRFYKSGLSE